MNRSRYSEQAGQADNCSVLVVDDEPEITGMLGGLLGDRGYKVFTAPDGPTALDIYRQNRPRIVLTDIKMPGMSGLELLKAIKESDDGRVEVIIFSGCMNVDDAIKSLHYGAVRCLRKPVAPRDLLDTIKEVSGRLAASDRKNALLESLGMRFKEKTLELKEKEKHLYYLSNFDSLTGLPNKAMFEKRLGHALDHARRNREGLAILFLDIDRFSLINDTLGHLSGDRLLQDAADRLRGCLRRGDTIARFGGDEFVIMLQNAGGVREVSLIAQKILKWLSGAFILDGQEFFITASVGISVHPNDGAEAQSLLKNADAAMYRARELGGNNYQFYTEAMNSAVSSQLALGNRMHKALLSSEFRLFYQPQFDLNTGRISGVEALIRWQHPELGLVPPGQFIPLAELNGLIIPMGEWVLKTACAQGIAWQREARQPLSMAVNLSARQFLQHDLAQNVSRTLNETGLAPELLDLEITESILMHNPESSIFTMHELNSLGVRISVDDFGTGYSSLSRLKKFPIHTLKVDRSFVSEITTDPDDASIVTAVIAMAHSLKLKVIAEGVETVEQLEFLRSLGCDAVQGYLLSRPIPPEEMGGVFRDEAFTYCRLSCLR